MTEELMAAEPLLLSASLAYLHLLLERHAARLEETLFHEEPLDRAAQATAAEAAPESGSRLAGLVEVFGLSEFERDLLLLAAGLELDGTLAFACPEILANGQLTFSAALAVLPNPHWTALSPEAPLRYWHLLELGAGAFLTLSPLRIDERILHFLAGIDIMDQRLAVMVEPVQATEELTPRQLAQAERMADVWRVAPEEATPVLQLSGTSVAERRSLALCACERLGMRLYALPAHALPLDIAEMNLVLRLWEREDALGRCALLLEYEEPAGEEPTDLPVQRAIQTFAVRTNVPLFFSSSSRRFHLERTRLLFDLEPSIAERLDDQRLLWKHVLRNDAEYLNDEIDRLTFQFDLRPMAIRSAHAECASRLHMHPGAHSAATVGRALWHACRVQARPRLDSLVQRIDSTANWDDLIGTEAQIAMLRAMALQVRERATVYGRWQFSQRGEHGLGIAALFAGVSGTGKTLAAEVLAGELELDLYRVDLSAVVDKYIGETEKNLRRAFDAAEAGGAILLFDEADALFGKRSEVKDSHDRHANIEVSYLLQRMEAYRGLSILTTNMKDNLDPAFLRRLRFIVHFPFPDAALRARLWQRVFPAETPVSGLDYTQLARLNVAGGDIRNIALNAAFLAAHDGLPVTMHHLHRAARNEYSKLQRTLTETEVRGWEIPA